MAIRESIELQKLEEDELEKVYELSNASYKKETLDHEMELVITEMPLKDLFDPIGFITQDNIQVLFLGEGDFSFVRSIMQSYKPKCNILATTDMNYSRLLTQYPHVEKNIDYLITQDTLQLQLGIDATKITTLLPGRKFHYAFWNFPCDDAGLKGGQISINRHKQLMRSTIIEAAMYLYNNGQIRITLMMAHPYVDWIEDLVESIQTKYGEMSYVGTIDFDCSKYPGYKHVTTFSKQGPKNIMIQSATHVWLKHQPLE